MASAPPTSSAADAVLVPTKRARVKGFQKSLTPNNQKLTVTSSAIALHHQLAAQAATSYRRTARQSVAKNVAIISTETSWAEVLQW